MQDICFAFCFFSRVFGCPFLLEFVKGVFRKKKETFFSQTNMQQPNKKQKIEQPDRTTDEEPQKKIDKFKKIQSEEQLLKEKIASFKLELEKCKKKN